MNADTTGDFNLTFKSMDKDGDGFLSEEELASGMLAYGGGYSSEELKELFNSNDKDMDGKLNASGKDR